MKERPILFSAPMVLAILEGRKTQTRRAMKFQLADDATPEIHDGKLLWRYPDETLRAVPYCSGNSKYGQPGDWIWVREAWRTAEGFDIYPPRDIQATTPIRYEADGAWTFPDVGMAGSGGKYRPPMFMPRWASRINLEITGVRVERLQDISETDAIAEGVSPDMDIVWQTGDDTPVGMFGELWESINGRGSWDVTPWVWVIEFRRMS